MDEIKPCPFCGGEMQSVMRSDVWVEHRFDGRCIIGDKRFRLADWNRRAPATPQPLAVAPADDARVYPCTDCGKMRSKAEGGTTFTVCDSCFGKPQPAPPPAAKESLPATPERMCNEQQCWRHHGLAGGPHPWHDVRAEMQAALAGAGAQYKAAPPPPDPLLCAAFKWAQYVIVDASFSEPDWVIAARDRYGVEALLKGAGK